MIGAFYSTKTSENSEMGTNVQIPRENPPGTFPENPEIDEFLKSEPFNRKFWEPGSSQGNGNSLVYNYLAMVSSFLKVQVNADPFVTENFMKFKAEFFIECKAFSVARREHREAHTAMTSPSFPPTLASKFLDRLFLS